ncbi:sensor histidine kinase [Kineococcus gynurae]|uniref:histidine kinase n=1 Tax=Kineococcus gynurae TaxID=452979 RepID=A0ABV5LVR9_9ACTN
MGSGIEDTRDVWARRPDGPRVRDLDEALGRPSRPERVPGRGTPGPPVEGPGGPRDERAPLEPDRVRRWMLLDGIGALLLAVVTGVALGSEGGVSLVVALALCAPLTLRRTHPELSGALVATVGLLQVPVLASFAAANVAVLFSVYALAAYARPWAARGGLLLGLFGAGVAALAYFGSEGLTVVALTATFIAVVVVTAWALGRLRRAGMRNARSQRERLRLLQNEREQELRMAAVSERQRIAREMHDVVAHSLSVIIAQADGGRYAAQTDPTAAATALETISSTGRQALADMRNLLGVLRAGPADERRPQPDATQIADLVTQVRASGLPVTLQEEGSRHDLPPAVGLAAYRIVQESLTNVLKHAGPAASARVRLDWGPDALDLHVEDDGRGAGTLAASGGGGQGLIGMAERARLHGGTLEARPRPGGGFSVRARLPYAAPGGRAPRTGTRGVPA